MCVCVCDPTQECRQTHRVGQNLVSTPYMTVHLLISLPKTTYVHRTHMLLASPINTAGSNDLGGVEAAKSGWGAQYAIVLSSLPGIAVCSVHSHGCIPSIAVWSVHSHRCIPSMAVCSVHSHRCIPSIAVWSVHSHGCIPSIAVCSVRSHGCIPSIAVWSVHSHGCIPSIAVWSVQSHGCGWSHVRCAFPYFCSSGRVRPLPHASACVQHTQK